MNTRTKGELLAYGTETNVLITAMWCPTCGVPYGLAESYRDRRQNDHKGWTCPNGCSVHYPEGASDIEKKAKKLQEEKVRLQRQLGWAREDRDAQREGRLTAERQRAAAKGQVTKIKNRVWHVSDWATASKSSGDA